MKRTLVILVAIVAVAGSVAAALAESGPSAGRDANREVVTLAPAEASALAEHIYHQVVPDAPANLCAIVVLPGPAGSFNIQQFVFNVMPTDDTLDVLIENSFHALGGASLLNESMFNIVPPAGGSLTVEYPAAGGGKGPVVLSFTGFGLGNSASYNLDPDTYDDPAFGATVLDMNGTHLEAVYSAAVPGSTRCHGTKRFRPALNASIAFLTQTFP